MDDIQLPGLGLAIATSIAVVMTDAGYVTVMLLLLLLLQATDKCFRPGQNPLRQKPCAESKYGHTSST